jgi:3-oxoacyl-[acyl-carrier-protein] synthase III
MCARILSAGTALPGEPIGTADLAECFGMNALWQQWVDSFIGTRSRYLAVDLRTGRQNYTLADLGELAATEALGGARLSAEDVDAIVMATATPDELMPATVNVIADRLGIDGIPTFQLQSGCSGAVQAFDVASALLGGDRYRTVLVIGGDVIARHYDVTADLNKVQPSELVNFVLFGDGAGAAVLSSEPGGGPEVRAVRTELTGLGREPGQVLRWFGLVDRAEASAPAREDYKAIEEHVPRMAKEMVDELLEDLGWARDEVDYLLPPQLSVVMTQKIVELLDCPAAREVSVVADIGNNGNPLLFFQLKSLLDEMTGNAKAIAVAIESSKWIKSGLALESA